MRRSKPGKSARSIVVELMAFKVLTQEELEQLILDDDVQFIVAAFLVLLDRAPIERARELAVEAAQRVARRTRRDG